MLPKFPCPALTVDGPQYPMLRTWVDTSPVDDSEHTPYHVSLSLCWFLRASATATGTGPSGRAPAVATLKHWVPSEGLREAGEAGPILACCISCAHSGQSSELRPHRVSRRATTCPHHGCPQSCSTQPPEPPKEKVRSSGMSTWQARQLLLGLGDPSSPSPTSRLALAQAMWPGSAQAAPKIPAQKVGTRTKQPSGGTPASGSGLEGSEGSCKRSFPSPCPSASPGSGKMALLPAVPSREPVSKGPCWAQATLPGCARGGRAGREQREQGPGLKPQSYSPKESLAVQVPVGSRATSHRRLRRGKGHAESASGSG